MRIKIPKHIKKLLYELNRNGYKAYVVGGAIRNQLLGKEIKDYDIATNATPDKIQEIFSSNDIFVIPTGLKHGTVTLVVNEENVEVTTFRKEGAYSDNRRPDSVEFIDDLKEDLSRRDFTINALAYHPKEGLIDYFGGVDDLMLGIVRCVGNPKERFSEDALRILRAIRFCNQFNFHLEFETKLEILVQHSNLQNISVERKRMEFDTIMKCGHEINYFSLLQLCLPEIFTSKTKERQLKGNKLLNIIEPKDLIVNLALFLAYGVLKKDFLSTYKYDNKTLNDVMCLWKCYTELRERLDEIGNMEDVRYFCKKFLMGRYQHECIANSFTMILSEVEYDYNTIQNLSDELVDIAASCEPTKLNHLAINGDDLKDLGYEGKDIGDMLDKIQEYIWRNPMDNQKNKLLEMIQLGKFNY